MLSIITPPPAIPLTVNEPGNGILECWRLPISEVFLRKLFEDIFVDNWHQIQYGILIQGGVLEFTPPCAPTKFGYLDGYLTIEFGKFGHLHLCVGLNKGYGCTETPEVVSRLRLPSRVELYRKLNGQGAPTFWGLRTFNSREPDPEQTLHIYLPNPLLTREMDYADPPAWERLSLWDHLRKFYLGIDEADPKDRLAKSFTHD